MEKNYSGQMTDENIRYIFRDAADFIPRQLRCGEQPLSAQRYCSMRGYRLPKL